MTQQAVAALGTCRMPETAISSPTSNFTAVICIRGAFSVSISISYVDMDTDNLTRQQAGPMTSPSVIDLGKSYSRPSGAIVPVPVLARGMVDSGDAAEAGSRSRGIAVSKTRWTQLSATSGRA
jgi:hypothetical protein